MTRRDFQLIAGVIAELRIVHGESLPIEALVRRLGDELYGTNPRFDRGRFERAARFSVK